jgi:hypothetical protein
MKGMRVRPCASLCVALFVGAFVVNTSCSTFSEGSSDVGDAGNDVLAAVDGQSLADAGGADAACNAPRFCDCHAGATFCTDFDDTDLFGVWNKKNERGGGTLVAGTSDRSSPSALRANAPANATADSVATLEKNLVGNVGEMVFEFDMAPKKVGATDVPANTSPGLLTLDGVTFSDNSPTRVALLVTKTSPTLFVKNGQDQYTSLPPFPLKAWTRITLRAHAGFLTVRYDGRIVTANPIPFPVTSAAPLLTVGVYNPALSTESDVWYDNLVITLAK